MRCDAACRRGDGGDAAPSVGVYVDEAGRGDHAASINGHSGTRIAQITHLGNRIAANADIGIKPRRAGPVDNPRPADQDVEGRPLCPKSRTRQQKEDGNAKHAAYCIVAVPNRFRH